MNTTVMQNVKHKLLPEKIVQQAITWHIYFESGNAQPKDFDDYKRWRLADPMHELASQRIELLESTFSNATQKSASIVHSTLQKTDRDIQCMSRRQALKRIAGTTLSLASVCWLADKQGAWQYLNADYATTNQRELFTLADNSQLWLNSGSTVELDFNNQNKHIHLTRGEMQYTSSANTQRLQIKLNHGVLISDSKKFFVRYEDDYALIKVMQGSIVVKQPDSLLTNRVINAGELYKITSNSVYQLDNHIFDYSSWTEGLLSVRSMPIKHFIAELSRYHRGFVKCAPDLDGYLVSGVFQLSDTNLILTTIARTARAKVHHMTRWWTEIRP
ncbi:FecR domain-containing protein [Pseudoalteromonas sp. NGC95]|uniref:FecR domain-containing protein n=1 Tax=Pseudoalteromonas sp. NGC95 TaxID=2792051 RepID=UPI0018CD72FD|nr:FecR domain-containing protein [Pseudoalteromonas sp. NGC95]MBH0017871.1 FecR domain-containing protein [Pseudoalteromonas sp. NGC95]